MTLIHVIAALSVLAFFVLLASELTAQCVRLWQTLPERESAVNRLDHAMRSLHRDTWSAHELTAAAPDRLVLEMADGAQVVWTIEADEPMLRRTIVEREAADARPARSWRLDVHEAMTFEADGVAARLVAGERSVTFVSQVRLARGRTVEGGAP